MISIEDFKKIDVRVGKILSAEKVANSDKLLKLILDVGEKDELGETIGRQVLAGVAEVYPDPLILIGKEIPVIINLEPRKLRGQMSNGMILAAVADRNRPVLLCPIEHVPPGSVVR